MNTEDRAGQRAYPRFLKVPQGGFPWLKGATACGFCSVSLRCVVVGGLRNHPQQDLRCVVVGPRRIDGRGHFLHCFDILFSTVLRVGILGWGGVRGGWG